MRSCALFFLLLHSWSAAAGAAGTFTLSGRIHISGSAVNGANEESKECREVVVFVEPAGDLKLPATVPSSPVTVRQTGKKFSPEILPIIKGTTVRFPNEDHIFHNVFSLSKTKQFDLGSFGFGKEASVTFDKSGLVVTYCNIHPEMINYILVLENDFHRVVDGDCLFSFQGLPDGKYLLKAWYRYGEGVEIAVDSANKGDVTLDLNLKRTLKKDLSLEKTKLNFQHLNKWGKPYMKTY